MITSITYYPSENNYYQSENNYIPQKLFVLSNIARYIQPGDFMPAHLRITRVHNFLGPCITPCYGNTCAWGTKKYAWEREHRSEYHKHETMNTLNIVATFSLVSLVMYVVVAWSMRAPPYAF